MMVICYDNYRHDLQDHHYKGAFLQSLQSRPSVLSRPQQFSFFFSSFSSFSFSFFSSFFPIIPGHPCFPGDTPSCYCCCCDHPEGQASCRWSSGGTGLLANDHPEGPSSCKLIIRMGRPLANDQIIRRDRPLANEYPDGPASCKWSSGETGLYQDPESISRTFLICSWFYILSRFLKPLSAGSSTTLRWTDLTETQWSLAPPELNRFYKHYFSDFSTIHFWPPAKIFKF